MRDTDYSFGNKSETPGRQDNRGDYRLTARATATLELEASGPGISGPDTDGRRLECRIRDISAAGCSLFASEPLSIGALLPVTVLLEHQDEPISLAAEVVWCRPNDAGFLVGLHVLESDGTGYVEWVEAVAAALGEG
ncbi:type IV pilus assembly PilZ [Marinobacter nitratireducens]|uniref:Type IV pilus assembly PilZ n=1 Tax=Marinobacter nitratireducens TaxID=1137280 RepID=A0A072NGS7_9GAMM|nr:PilZ domain-containing protein [Marinobacter nitratireducens]KEF32325.1 type IV pilus assembly PilZ [Marinobacter nitratireducens]TNE93657.1 MAG: PilZ domain-containing protein [Gammaproteobacteria bacterium]